METSLLTIRGTIRHHSCRQKSPGSSIPNCWWTNYEVCRIYRPSLKIVPIPHTRDPGETLTTLQPPICLRQLMRPENRRPENNRSLIIKSSRKPLHRSSQETKQGKCDNHHALCHQMLMCLRHNTALYSICIPLTNHVFWLQNASNTHLKQFFRLSLLSSRERGFIKTFHPKICLPWRSFVQLWTHHGDKQRIFRVSYYWRQSKFAQTIGSTGTGCHHQQKVVWSRTMHRRSRYGAGREWWYRGGLWRNRNAG